MSTVLWWGRFDPDYSRNRILRTLFAELGWTVRDFHPAVSGLANHEAILRRVERPDLVWVPCFRQRDLLAASRWAKLHSVPLIFDPLISAYDKQVDERGKLVEGSPKANKLLAWERGLFARASLVLADTPAHADYFLDVLGVEHERLAVVFVGAEKSLFRPLSLSALQAGEVPEVLFYGSFIPLQGPQVIVEAARLYNGPPVRWTLIGKGPLHDACMTTAAALGNVRFEDWVPYEGLSARIGRAHILLGIFGTTPKAARVIPNKVYQSLACGRVVITRRSAAYPQQLVEQENSGLMWVDAGDARGLAEQVAELAGNPDSLCEPGKAAAVTSNRYFSNAVLKRQLSAILADLSL